MDDYRLFTEDFSHHRRTARRLTHPPSHTHAHRGPTHAQLQPMITLKLLLLWVPFEKWQIKQRWTNKGCVSSFESRRRNATIWWLTTMSTFDSAWAVSRLTHTEPGPRCPSEVSDIQHVPACDPSPLHSLREREHCASVVCMRLMLWFAPATFSQHWYD